MRSRFSTACSSPLSPPPTKPWALLAAPVSRAQRPQNPSASVGARFGSSYAGPPLGFSRAGNCWHLDSCFCCLKLAVYVESSAFIWILKFIFPEWYNQNFSSKN